MEDTVFYQVNSLVMTELYEDVKSCLKYNSNNATAMRDTLIKLMFKTYDYALYYKNKEKGEEKLWCQYLHILECFAFLELFMF